MRFRPAGPILPWADDLVYAAPGEDWDTDPNKIQPATGIVGQGWSPNEQPSPERLNWLQNHRDSVLKHLDCIDVQNWSPVRQLASSAFRTDPVRVIPAAKFPTLATGGIFASLADTVYRAVRGSFYQADTMPVGGPALIRMLNQFPVTGAFGAGAVAAGNQLGFMTLGAGTNWTLVGTSDTANYQCSVYHAGTNKIYMGASKASAPSVPKIVSLATDLVTFVITSLPAPTGYTNGAISHMATDGTRIVAVCGDDSAGASISGLAFYHSTDGTTWTAGSIPTNRECHSFFYDSTRAAWYLIDQSTNLWKSDDGVTWADTGTDVNIDTLKKNNVAALGGQWLVVNGDLDVEWTIDECATMNNIPDPFEGDGVSSGVTSVQPFALADNFALHGRPSIDGGTHHLVYSLRCAGA